MTVPCDRCDESREKGYRFCIYCGEMLGPLPRSGCERCEECRKNGNIYCTYCGKRLVEEENPFLKIGFYIGLVTATLLSFLLLFEYFVALWGIPQVLPHLPDYGSTLILVIPVVVDVVSFNGVMSQIYYLMLVLAVTVCLALYAYKSFGPAKNLFKGDDRSIRNTAFYDVCVLFSTLFFWEFALILILNALGIETNPLPKRDDWVWMYEFIEASVWEEVITRMLMIGLPVTLVALLMKQEGKGSLKYLFGGMGFNKFTIVLIFFSALMFAAGHVGGWGWWKFFPTFAFGLITGYLFCKYGVYATIMMHFLTDYVSAESWFFNCDSPVATALMIMLLSLACIPFTFVYLKRGAVALYDIFVDQSKGLK